MALSGRDLLIMAFNLVEVMALAGFNLLIMAFNLGEVMALPCVTCK